MRVPVFLPKQERNKMFYCKEHDQTKQTWRIVERQDIARIARRDIGRSLGHLPAEA
jgi:hypothetical protein